MRFLPELVEYLKTHSRIYTVRSYRYPLRSLTHVDDVGLCKRTLVGQIHALEDLTPYVARSGFKDAESWWTQIKQFVKGLDPMYLYEVIVHEG